MFLSEHRRFLYLHLTDVISSADLPRPTLNLYSYKTVQYHESDAHEIFLDFIDTHAAVLDSAFAKVQMSESMRSSLQKSDWMFSGLKTFHELHEAFPSLIDEKGERKPFERFYNDVQKVDETYNRNYLRAEFNFATASAEMAARWEEFERDGDRYYLQYRTGGDDRVRGVIDPFSRYAEKSKLMRALHGVTLPVGHPFWDSHFPPNGWNCRCDVMQVRKSSHEATSEDALSKCITALNTEQERQKTKREMFRFNPGKQKKVFPDYHPYSIKRCNDCDLAKGKMCMAFVPSNEACAGCQLLRECFKDKQKSHEAKLRKHYLYKMERLLDTKHALDAGGKTIQVGFSKKGNKHLYSDAVSRSRILKRDDLEHLDQLMKKAKYVGENELTHARKDAFERFLYFEVELHGRTIRLNIGKSVVEKPNGKNKVEYTMYAINDK